MHGPFLPSLVIDRSKDHRETFSQRKFLQANHSLRFQSLVLCDFGIIPRPQPWDRLCGWDTLEDSCLHAVCLVDKADNCIGSITFDNQHDASQCKETYILTGILRLLILHGARGGEMVRGRSGLTLGV